jgi:hypothetical protein
MNADDADQKNSSDLRHPRSSAAKKFGAKSGLKLWLTQVQSSRKVEPVALFSSNPD